MILPKFHIFMEGLLKGRKHTEKFKQKKKKKNTIKETVRNIQLYSHINRNSLLVLGRKIICMILLQVHFQGSSKFGLVALNGFHCRRPTNYFNNLYGPTKYSFNNQMDEVPQPIKDKTGTIFLTGSSIMGSQRIRLVSFDFGV